MNFCSKCERASVHVAIPAADKDSDGRVPSDQPFLPVGRWVRILLSYGIGAAGLYWAFHDIRFEDVMASIENTAWPWLIPGAVLQLLVYVCAGWEWKILLQPVGNASFLRLTQAVFAGRFANDVLPFHAGYIVRVYLASRWMQTGAARIVPSLLIERLLDGFWLALGIGIIAGFVPLPGVIARAAQVWGGIILFGLVALGGIVLRKRDLSEKRAPTLDGKWLGKIRNFGSRLLREVRAVARSWSFLKAIAVSALKFIAQCLAFLVLFWAYGLEIPIWAQVAVFQIVYVGMSVPSTPASVGVFQFFCVAGLQLFGVPKASATGFSILAFLVVTLPLSVAGFLALAQSGVRLGEVRAGLRQQGTQ